MTPKELYELAKVAGAKDYKIEMRSDKAIFVAKNIKLDYICHSQKRVVLTDTRNNK